MAWTDVGPHRTSQDLTGQADLARDLALRTQVELRTRHRWLAAQQEQLGPVYRTLGFLCKTTHIFIRLVPPTGTPLVK